MRVFRMTGFERILILYIPVLDGVEILRVIHGSRVSLLVAFAVVFVSGFVGITLGAISGYFGGKVDFMIQKLVEVVWAVALPMIVSAATAI